MNDLQRRALAISIAVASCLLTTPLQQIQATMVSPPPDNEYAAQAWVGFSQDDRYSIRLQLALPRSGSGILIFEGQEPEPFEVTSWQIERRGLHLSTSFVSPTLRGAELSGAFKIAVLSYTTTGPSGPDLMSGRPADLPGPLELDLNINGRRIRFGAWPESELAKRLDAIRQASTANARRSK